VRYQTIRPSAANRGDSMSSARVADRDARDSLEMVNATPTLIWLSYLMGKACYHLELRPPVGPMRIHWSGCM